MLRIKHILLFVESNLVIGEQMLSNGVFAGYIHELNNNTEQKESISN